MGSIDDGRSFRFGGHQTFALRSAWLPKAARAIESGSDPFADLDRGIVELGLGKNMVEALRCWVDAYGVASRLPEGGWGLTREGRLLFGSGGLDRFLEDVRTLWFLHWRISSMGRNAFFAWELLFNRWNEADFAATAVVSAFAKEADRDGRPLSPVSARQHYDVWLHTYVATRAGSREDELDSPLSALRLVRRVGEREVEGGRREPVFAFDFGAKGHLSQAMFLFFLSDWWDRARRDEGTVPFADVATSPGSPGRLLKMGEAELRDRLCRAARDADAGLELVESVNLFQVRRSRRPAPIDMLAAAYGDRA